MNHIGNRIRELRREARLTQEKLAGYLNVSYQTVSKWETGVNTPDLVYLVPLSKLLHTTTDDLLGNAPSPEEADKHKKELEAAWKEAWEDKQEGERLIAAARALTEAYPENPLYWWRLAYGERMRAHEMNEPEQEEERTAFFEQALTHFQMVIEDAEKESLKNGARADAANVLIFLNRREEARRYAEQLPEGEARNHALRLCLPEEERILLKQQMLQSAMIRYLNELILLLTPSEPELLWPAELIIEILSTMIPDGNYLSYRSYLITAYERCAQCYLRENRPEDAVLALKKAWQHAREKDRFHAAPGEYPLTAPCFDRLTVRSRPMKTSFTDNFRNSLKKPWTKPLREREDFCALADECGVHFPISD